MNRYFLVLDSKNRVVFKKKLNRNESEELLLCEYQKGDFIPYLLEGRTFVEALAAKDLNVREDSAFYIKRNLKEELYFTDKRIQELLGKPDRIEKVKGGRRDQFMHLYSKTRVEAVMATSEYRLHAEKVKANREARQSKIDPLQVKAWRDWEMSNRRGPHSHRGEGDPFLQGGVGPRRKEGRGLKPRPDLHPPRTEVRGYSVPTRKRIKELAGRLKKDWDLDEYKEFFPLAREIKRKHTLYVGPTNSGKTYRGFNELSQADSGVYLAPLRLLALEGQEEIEKRGKPCSLLTGEECELKENASFVASTIEMANLDQPIDIALVDEVQLLLDRNRGWAWSQAIIGIPASRIIMTGSAECVPTLRKLIEDYLGEELEILPLERIGRLEVLDRPIENLNLVEAGTAIIAFSRKGVLSFKKDLERMGRRVSVLYGNLSPGVRREEARRFRSGETEILVATDCIGMGLNLPIKTVLFSETSKFDGREVRELTAQEVKQIGGRAGRFGKFECGYVGVSFYGRKRVVIQSFSSQQKISLEPIFVRPTRTQLEILSAQIGTDQIRSAIALFSRLSKLGSTIVSSDMTEMLSLAGRIEALESLSKLPFSDKYLFVCAPVSGSDLVVDTYLQWLVSYSNAQPVHLDEQRFRSYSGVGCTSEDSVLNHVENLVKSLTLYHWLARKKPESFPDFEKCERLREQLNGFIENSLKRKRISHPSKKISKQPISRNSTVASMEVNGSSLAISLKRRQGGAT